MRKFLFLSTLTVILLQTSCKKDKGPKPEAYFEASKYTCYAPCSVNFYNSSTNAKDFVWDFGDISKSSERDPSHLFITPGNYNVRLEAINEDQNDIYYREIQVKLAPQTVKITWIAIYGFPNSNWDLGNGPEIYATIADANNNPYWTSSQTANVVAASLPLIYNSNYSFPINQIRYIDLWDADSPDTDDYMGWVRFDPSDFLQEPNQYPETISITQNNITIQLTLNWE
jgi:hypothetical protein